MSNKKNQSPNAAQKEFVLDHEEYQRVSCAATLREVKLIDSVYSIKPDVVEVLQDLDKLDLKFSGDCAVFNFNEDEGIVVGAFEWEAEIKEGRKKCLRMKSKYLLVYTGFSGCDESHVVYFFSKVGRFATYPYFRSHFSHHITESGLMMPPLPTLKERVD